MSVSNLTLQQVGASLFVDTDNGAAEVLVKGSSGTFLLIDVDNSNNSGAASFVKLFDSAGVIVVGTDDPDWILKVPPAFSGPVLVSPKGTVFANGLQVATLTEGGTGGVTAPASPVLVRIVYS